MSVQDPQVVQRLADETLQHLDRERRQLQRTVDKAAVVRARLLKRETESLQSDVAELEAMQQQAGRLSKYREHLRGAIAVALAVPTKDATIRALAAQVDARRRSQLLESRVSLAQLTGELWRMQRANLTIASAFSQFAIHLLDTITGQPAQPRYGKFGQLENDSNSHLFQAEL